MVLGILQVVICVALFCELEFTVPISFSKPMGELEFFFGFLLGFL